MANNELFYRVAREALNDDTSICGLVIDLDTAIESYLVELSEHGLQSMPGPVKEEIKVGLIHAEVLVRNLKAWT